MRKTALAIRHVHFENLGTFEAVLTELGYDVVYVDAATSDLRAVARQSVDLLIALGGPIGVYENDLYPSLSPTIEVISARLSARQPTLGICLGAQLMAAALGSRVYPGPAKEIGWFPVELTDTGRAGPLRYLDGCAVLHWHGDTFDLPPGAVRLASTPICANQAFSIGDHALAFQFHPEVDRRFFEHWLIGHAVEISAARVSVTALRADAEEFGQTLENAGQACIRQWLSSFSGAK